ncbi:MAG: alkaline phosphatase family protein [Candidatus Sulfotelmatobacter sp.]|jgi:acid phosphatase
MTKFTGFLTTTFGTLALILSQTAHAQTLPKFGHVVIVVGENTAYGTSYDSKNMPYLTSLANAYGLGTNYYSDTHPSIGNYLNLATGYLITDDDNQTPKTLPVSDNNIALEAQNAGLTWKDYVESLPSVKGCGGLKSGTYYVRHDPLEYMTTINTETENFVCFSQFATDLANHNLPNFSWLVPNGCDDAHDCTLKTFDNWLSTEIAPLVASSYFQAGGDGLLIIVFDENNSTGTPDCETTTDGLGCGGKVELVVISPYSKKAYKSKGGDSHNYKDSYEEGNILRTMAQGLGLPTSNLGAATLDIPMADFF